jgi:hypothetical protein
VQLRRRQLVWVDRPEGQGEALNALQGQLWEFQSTGQLRGDFGVRLTGFKTQNSFRG